ncbi:MAG TPA: DUF202 domain-containing protein [Lysobacter sp.]
MQPILPDDHNPELPLPVKVPQPPFTTADAKSVELSSRRTGMSFQRTRMSADRTLMSIIRTALSLISFGFTIFQVFQKMQESKILDSAGREPRNFGIALVVLGMVMLTLGIVYHINYMRELRAERVRMMEQGLVHGESKYPVSLTLITAALLWLLGLLAAASMAFNVPLLG